MCIYCAYPIRFIECLFLGWLPKMRDTWSEPACRPPDDPFSPASSHRQSCPKPSDESFIYFGGCFFYAARVCHRMVCLSCHRFASFFPPTHVVTCLGFPFLHLLGQDLPRGKPNRLCRNSRALILEEAVIPEEAVEEYRTKELLDNYGELTIPSSRGLLAHGAFFWSLYSQSAHKAFANFGGATNVMLMVCSAQKTYKCYVSTDTLPSCTTKILTPLMLPTKGEGPNGQQIVRGPRALGPPGAALPRAGAARPAADPVVRPRPAGGVGPWPRPPRAPPARVLINGGHSPEGDGRSTGHFVRKGYRAKVNRRCPRVGGKQVSSDGARSAIRAFLNSEPPSHAQQLAGMLLEAEPG